MNCRILFVADSRGRLLHHEISKHFHPSCYEFIWRGGLSLQDSTDFARSTILRFRPSIVYNLTGICSITRITNRDPWTAGLRYPTVLGTTSLFIEAMDKAYQETYSLSLIIGKPIMIVFPTQVGLDLDCL